MELLEAIQISALKSVLQPDDEYFMRRVFRWYSEKFHTPLHQVEDLPPDEVLQTYFECSFEQMGTRKLKNLAKKLTGEVKPKKPRQLRKKKAEKVVSDDEFLKLIREKAVGEEEVLEARRKAKEKSAQDMMDALDDLDPLAPVALPEFESKFNSNLE